jgi:hypothetical protein
MSGELDLADREALRFAGERLMTVMLAQLNASMQALCAQGHDPAVVALASINASASVLANALVSQVDASMRAEVAADIIDRISAAVRYATRPHAGPVTIQ